jgi:hypothetical protein
MSGTLEVHAYENTEEVAAEVEIVGVGKYDTPFKIQLPEGTYILIANWMGQQQIKAATVETDKTTAVNFYFIKPSMALAYFFAATSAISTIVSILGLWIALTRKK